MKIQSLAIVGVAVLAVGGVVAYHNYAGMQAMKAMMSAVPPPATVSSASVSQQTWRAGVSAVASLESHQGIVLSSEVAGTIRRIRFESGDKVTEGQLLVELDDSTEQAQLAGLQAAAKLADLNLARARELRNSGTNTQLDLDTAEATLLQSNAAVDQVRAVIAKKHVSAPFPGTLGIRQVNTGQYVAAGAAFVQLENTDSVYADFGLPQQDLAELQPGMEVSLSVDAFPDKVFHGLVEALSPRIAEGTRSVRVRAVFPNADGALRAGMFARISAEVGQPTPVAVVPAASIVYSPYGDFVYVVTADASGAQAVRQQFVTLGEKRGDLVAVLKGLKAGDAVITSGMMKLRNGAPVKVDNRLPVDANPAPKPVES